jgi:hypothetical protein
MQHVRFKEARRKGITAAEVAAAWGLQRSRRVVKHFLEQEHQPVLELPTGAGKMRLFDRRVLRDLDRYRTFALSLPAKMRPRGEGRRVLLEMKPTRRRANGHGNPVAEALTNALTGPVSATPMPSGPGMMTVLQQMGERLDRLSDSASHDYTEQLHRIERELLEMKSQVAALYAIWMK